jgi:hypothetical protein
VRCERRAGHTGAHQNGGLSWDQPHIEDAIGNKLLIEIDELPVKRDLADWWRDLTEQEIAATVPKAIEYGATDLIDIGSQMGRFIGRHLTDQDAAELGCWFYLIGKMARATSAIERGEKPSDDTVKDIGVYVKMIQRIRSAGSWPGEDETK